MAKNIARKCSQKPLDHANNSAMDTPKLASKGQAEEKKRAEATGYLIGNKMADKITVMSKIFSKQLQMGMIKKYLKNDTYL